MEYAQHTRPFSENLHAASVAHLVVGTQLYLNDPRRTPVVVLHCDPATASFTVEVADFEDAGAVWAFALWDIAKFSVQADARRMEADDCALLEVNVKALNRNAHIPASDAARRQTLKTVRDLQRDVTDWLNQDFPNLPTDTVLQDPHLCPLWATAFAAFINAKNLTPMEQDFVSAYVSNPNAGEMIKGHRMTLAHLGLCSYEGPELRDPALMEGDWTLSKGGAHVMARLAFMRALLSRCGLATLPLYRAIYGKGGLDQPRNTGFVSTTLNRDVADALFQSGQKTNAAALYWQEVTTDRVFMSCIETPALSARYNEAEVVLIFDASNSIF